MSGEIKMVIYTRPSGNKIKVADGPGTKAYAKANGWLTAAEVKVKEAAELAAKKTDK